MLNTYIKNRGTSKTIIHNNNHNTISETKWDADYDGSVANLSLDLSKNGRNKHLDFQFTNDDLANMLSIPSVRQPIHKRLKIDFKKPESFKQIFLEVEPESDSSLDLDGIDRLFRETNKKDSSPILTHISSPLPGEEFIMPFQDYNLLSEQPVIKISHKPSIHKSDKHSKTPKKNSNKLSRKKSNRHRHHNYPSTRKSPRRSSRQSSRQN